MILEFGAKNFFSFKEGFEVLFQKSHNSTDDISNIIAIKGANASGKTNVIKTLSFLDAFAKDSFSDLKPDEDIGNYSFFNNSKPIEMYIVFFEKNITYRYELIFTNKKVISEKVYRTKKRETLIIERDENKVTTIEEYNELEKIKINRKNASIISIAKQYGILEIDTIFNLFKIYTNVNEHGKIDNKDRFLDVNLVSKLYYENKKLLNFVIDFLKKADIGISNIKIHKQKNAETGDIEYFPKFYYKINKKDTFLTYYEQSSGTQSLYLQLHFYITALDNGWILGLDEFDINLHPDLLPMILNMFENKKINVKNAQLILTTHNYDIMDRLGKYKIILVNKEENESFLYRLDEIPGDMIRKNRPISPIYNANKIGGKPKIRYCYGE